MSMSSKGWVIPKDSFSEKATASSGFTFFSLYFHMISLGCLWMVLNQEKVSATTVDT